MPYGVLQETGVNRFAARRGLRKLADAGLVSIQQSPGRSPVVEILDSGNTADL